MKVFIIEDEAPAAKRLSKMIVDLFPDTIIEGKADSIESAVRLLSTGPQPDLVFMDIQLADGLSFDIFEQVELTAPVIFTTAFNQYALRAFKVNSIDYLLKPIDENELKQAIEKHLHLRGQNNVSVTQQIRSLLGDLNRAKYRERIMIKKGAQFFQIKTSEVAYFYADDKLCFVVEGGGAKYLVESNLSQLEQQLDPSLFFRINRHMLVHIDAIKKVHTWLGSRLKLDIIPETNIDTVVSREKVNEFKSWFGGELIS